MTNRQVALICAIAVAYFRSNLKLLQDVQEFADWFYTWLERGKW